MNNKEISINYKIIVECILANVLDFNKKRIGYVQLLKIENYTSQCTTANQDESFISLFQKEKIISGSFIRVVVFGKTCKLEPV